MSKWPPANALYISFVPFCGSDEAKALRKHRKEYHGVQRRWRRFLRSAGLSRRRRYSHQVGKFACGRPRGRGAGSLPRGSPSKPQGCRRVSPSRGCGLADAVTWVAIRGAAPLRMCNRKCRSHTWWTEHVGACHVILHAGLFRGLGFVTTNHLWTPCIRFHVDRDNSPSGYVFHRHTYCVCWQCVAAHLNMWAMGGFNCFQEHTLQQSHLVQDSQI